MSERCQREMSKRERFQKEMYIPGFVGLWLVDKPVIFICLGSRHGVPPTNVEIKPRKLQNGLSCDFSKPVEKIGGRGGGGGGGGEEEAAAITWDWWSKRSAVQPKWQFLSLVLSQLQSSLLKVMDSPSQFVQGAAIQVRVPVKTVQLGQWILWWL